MKVIFLDIDGVLVHKDSLENGRLSRESGSFYYAAQLCPWAMTQLRRILDETGAKIVLSSTWRRFDEQTTGFRRGLINLGYPRDQLRGLMIGSTPYLPSEKREDEITGWLAKHDPVERYLAIDDGPIPGHPQLDPRPNHFQGGLLSEHADQAIAMLGRIT